MNGSWLSFVLWSVCEQDWPCNKILCNQIFCDQIQCVAYSDKRGFLPPTSIILHDGGIRDTLHSCLIKQQFQHLKSVQCPDASAPFPFHHPALVTLVPCFFSLPARPTCFPSSFPLPSLSSDQRHQGFYP